MYPLFFVNIRVVHQNTSLRHIVGFIRRIYANEPNGNAIFMIAGGPGDSADSFAGGAAYLAGEDATVGLKNSAITIPIY